MSSNFDTHGTGHYFGVRCSDEVTEQEWKQTMEAMHQTSKLPKVNGKPWQDPGIGKTRLGDGSPARSAELDAILMERRAKKNRVVGK